MASTIVDVKRLYGFRTGTGGSRTAGFEICHIFHITVKVLKLTCFKLYKTWRKFIENM